MKLNRERDSMQPSKSVLIPNKMARGDCVIREARLSSTKGAHCEPIDLQVVAGQLEHV